MRTLVRHLAGPLATMALLSLLPPAAHAGIPRPAVLIGCFPNQAICQDRSAVSVNAPAAACQYRFRIGGPESLTVSVTLRDGFDLGVAGMPTTIDLVPNAGTVALCGCCPLSRSATTDSAGVARVTFRGIGGAGSLDVAVTARNGPGNVGLFPVTIDFTTPDLGGSCEPANSTDVSDLARWAAGLSSYLRTSDFDCNLSVGIADLGYWAYGLGRGCQDATCP